MSKGNPMVRVRLEKTTYSRLLRCASENATTVSDILREALMAWFEAHSVPECASVQVDGQLTIDDN